MTILPKKKPSSGVGVSDHADDSDRRSGSDPHQHPHAGRTGARPRASPPPWSYQPAPPSARDDRRSIEASSRPQQASPPPVGSVSPVGPGDGRDSSGGMVAGSRGELVVSAGVVGCGGGIGSCCSGPGLSKRRRQAGTCSGGVVAALAGGGQPGVTGPGSSQDTEEGAGNNSEDEYENAARLQSMDPATVEQQEHWFEKALREKKGFVIKKMKEDGACLFRAVADQVYGDQDMHEVVRKHCMDYLMKNADYFSNYVTEDFTTYINRKRKNNCHGNHIEMQAMAEMYNRPVEVYQYSTVRGAVSDEVGHQDVGGVVDRAADVGGQEESDGLGGHQRGYRGASGPRVLPAVAAGPGEAGQTAPQGQRHLQLGDGGGFQRTGRLERPVATATRLRPLPLPLRPHDRPVDQQQAPLPRRSRPHPEQTPLPLRPRSQQSESSSFGVQSHHAGDVAYSVWSDGLGGR
ncbi:OTU domain-containing protein 5-A isoform X3 [Siniperca chuatsi]|uniref:OTU domain-containing protein 5-A isoform X3 n=1 Tax=Siniperca chuatsi TaxID=119488 RepID=UPI001CE20132|nr:OTU domain-containing protein 5-A isoform X3 [Siniperca chuatsi]